MSDVAHRPLVYIFSIYSNTSDGFLSMRKVSETIDVTGHDIFSAKVQRDRVKVENPNGMASKIIAEFFSRGRDLRRLEF